MLFNVAKCKVMYFGYNYPRVNYEMDGTDLEGVSNDKDVGVVITCSANLKYHNKVVASKANKILGMIKHNS